MDSTSPRRISKPRTQSSRGSVRGIIGRSPKSPSRSAGPTATPRETTLAETISGGPTTLKPRWHFNTTVALTVNALTHRKTHGGVQLGFYLGNIFMILTEATVREDFAQFLKVVASQKSLTETELWRLVFGGTQKPAIASLVQNAAAITEMNNFQTDQFSVRPMDMKLAFPEKHILDVSMCTMMEQISEKVESLEANAQGPPDKSRRIETLDQSTNTPLLKHQRAKLTAIRRLNPTVVATNPPHVLTPFSPNLKLNVDVYGPMRYQKLVFDGRTWTQRRDNRVLTFSFSGKVGF